jgi:hypothetical protein
MLSTLCAISPPSLDTSVFKYLAYIRPFVDFLARRLNLPQYQSREFLFPDPKLKNKHISTT